MLLRGPTCECETMSRMRLYFFSVSSSHTQASRSCTPPHASKLIDNSGLMRRTTICQNSVLCHAQDYLQVSCTISLVSMQGLIIGEHTQKPYHAPYSQFIGHSSLRHQL